MDPRDPAAGLKMEVVDTALRAERRRLKIVSDATCRPGCNGCCSRLVAVSLAEAVVLYEELVAKGLWPDVRARAEADLPLLSRSDQVSWFKMNRKCAVLDLETGRCRAYSVRPAACSTHFSRSHPDLCDPWKPARGEFRPVDFVDLHARMLDRIRSARPDMAFLLTSAPMPLALLMAERVRAKTGVDVPTALAAMGRSRRAG